MAQSIYNKVPATVDAQMEQLKARGLSIPDDDYTRHFLSNISYYRLAGYWWPMQTNPKDQHVFKPNSRFEYAVALYNFDRALLILLCLQVIK